MPTPYETVYGAIRAFLISFAEAVKAEIKDSGVGITLLMPGQGDTPFWTRARLVDNKFDVGEKADPAKVASEGYEGAEGRESPDRRRDKQQVHWHVLNNVTRDTVQLRLHAAGAGGGTPRPRRPVRIKHTTTNQGVL